MTKIIASNQLSTYSGVIGGKVQGLILLQENQFNVPEFYILIDAEKTQIKDAIYSWKKKFQISNDAVWAVRSSADVEDGDKKSFAGQFLTRINILTKDLYDAIVEVIKSFNKNDSYSKGVVEFTIVIQKMIQPDYSGVFFTKDPIKPYSQNSILSIIPGLGEELVSGREDGLSIEFEGDKSICNSKNTNIKGKKWFGGKNEVFYRLKDDVLKDLNPFYPEILSKSVTLEQRIKRPLDFEFVISGGELFWLQVRSITTRKIKEIIQVWDNTSIEANFSGVTLPLTTSFLKHTYYKAYKFGALKIGFSKNVIVENEHLLTNMCDEIDGGLYYNVTAWQNLIYHLPFGKKISQSLPKIWGMDEVKLESPNITNSFFTKGRIFFRLFNGLFSEKKNKKRYLMAFDNIVQLFNDNYFFKGDKQQIIDKYLEMEHQLASNWLAPLVNGLHTIINFSILKRLLKKSRIVDKYPNYINDIHLAEGEVISVKIVQSFQDILIEGRKQPEILELILITDVEQLYKEIEVKFPNYSFLIKEYIRKYGNRTNSGELKMETISYKTNPNGFMKYMKENIGFSLKGKSERKYFDYNKTIDQLYPKWNLKRFLLKFFTRKSIDRMKARENYRFMRVEIFAISRMIFLEIGERLVTEKKIDTQRDVLFLRMNELFQSSSFNFKSLVDERKEYFENLTMIKRSNRYVFVQDRFFPIHDESIIHDEELKGISCCSGKVRAKVRIIDEQTDLKEDFSNCILIAHFFEPGWISIFNQAKGIISERGNLLSHTAIICRELNIPSIIGMKGVVHSMDNGDYIEMDGSLGTVKRIENV